MDTFHRHLFHIDMGSFFLTAECTKTFTRKTNKVVAVLPLLEHLHP